MCGHVDLTNYAIITQETRHKTKVPEKKNAPVLLWSEIGSCELSRMPLEERWEKEDKKLTNILKYQKLKLN